MIAFSPKVNEELLLVSLDLDDEKREEADFRVAAH